MTTSTPPDPNTPDPYGTPPLFDAETFAVPRDSLHFRLHDVLALRDSGGIPEDLEVHLGPAELRRSLSGWCLTARHTPECRATFPTFVCRCACHG